jgi:hypothetical protein
MAKEYTVKIFGKTRDYKKVGNKYFQIMKDGKLNKNSASGAWRLQLENAANSRLVTTPKKVATSMLASVRSAVSSSKKNKRGQAQASTPKDDGGRAAYLRSEIIDKLKKDKALATIKKDTSNTKTDRKISMGNKKTDKKIEKKVEKKKDIKPLQKTQSKAIKSTTTKALQNKPKQNVKKKVEKKITKKPESKLDSKGNYKGTNIKPTKLQLDRLKKRGLA